MLTVGTYNLKIVEEDLESELGVSKSQARKGLTISKKLEKKKIEERIQQLQLLLDD